jgi:hypothetical protein
MLHTYRPYGGYGYRRRGACWIILFLALVVVAVPLSISLSLRYGTDSKDTNSNGEYALTDKVVHTYSNHFCQGLQAKSTNIPNLNYDKSNATLYLLNRYPSLSAKNENFNFSVPRNRFTAEGDYWDWNFYLNERSKAHFSACYDSDSSSYSGITFYAIKGHKNFNDWKDDPDNPDNVVYSKNLLSQCTNISYSVTVSDRYYFALYSHTFYRLWLDFDFRFERTVYDISSESVVQNCTIPLDGTSSCSIGVPMSSGYTAVLSLNTSLPVDYTDGADVEISCQPRTWLYAVIVLCTVLPVAVIVILVIVCVCVVVKRGKSKYTPLVGSDEPTAKDAFEDSANVNAPIVRPSVVVTTGGGGGGGAPAPSSNPPAGYPLQAGDYGTTAPILL